MNTNSKYYSNYDKNIKAIKGGGVITPSNPPNKTSQTNTIKNTWDNLNPYTPTPPLYKNVYYSDKNLTNGYLNDDNYIIENKQISNYYYPSQKFNKVYNINDSNNTNDLDDIKKKMNESNPIELPPPLIESNILNENTIYDGKYIYTIEDEPINLTDKQNYKIEYLPYLNVDKANLRNKIRENFNNQDTNKNHNMNNQFEPNNFEISNFRLLVVLSILLIIYFTIQQK